MPLSDSQILRGGHRHRSGRRDTGAADAVLRRFFGGYASVSYPCGKVRSMGLGSDADRLNAAPPVSA